MKRIPHPVVDDAAILGRVAGRMPVAGCPHIEDDTQIVRDRYDAYIAANANPFLPNCPQPLLMAGLLQNALSERYGRESEYLQPIENLRNNRALNICPMCGLPGTGTLDHIFPRRHYPELAIFSHNLVPTCWRCNTKHQANHRGADDGQRLFHPYFDDSLNNRLVRATIQANPDFGVPDIELESCLQDNDPLNNTVVFHIDTVLRPAGVLDDLFVFWADLRRFPRKELSSLPRGEFEDAEFNAAVINALVDADQWHTTPNNYKSMLFEGLRVNAAASNYLAQWIRNLDADPDLAQDV